MKSLASSTCEVADMMSAFLKLVFSPVLVHHSGQHSKRKLAESIEKKAGQPVGCNAPEKNPHGFLQRKVS